MRQGGFPSGTASRRVLHPTHAAGASAVALQRRSGLRGLERATEGRLLRQGRRRAKGHHAGRQPGRATSHPHSLADMHSLAVCLPRPAGCVEMAVGEAAWNCARPSPSSTHPPEACDVRRDGGKRRAELRSATGRRGGFAVS